MSLNVSNVTVDEVDQWTRIAQILIFMQIVISAVALKLNAIVFLIGCLHIRDSYRHYLSNLAVIDMGFACGALIAAVGQYFWIFPPIVLFVAEHLLSVTMPLMIVALVPISIDRYIKVCRGKRCPNAYWYHVPLICCLVDVFPSAIYYLCRELEVPDRILNTIYVIGIPACSLIVVFACNMALFRFVSRHERIIGGLENRKRLHETRQLARATCLQAIAPLVLQLPPLLGIYGMNTIGATEGTEPNMFIWHLAHFLFLAITMNPLFDAIVTIFVVRKYRDYFRKFLMRSLTRETTVDMVEMKQPMRSAKSTIDNQLSQMNSYIRGDDSARVMLNEPVEQLSHF